MSHTGTGCGTLGQGQGLCLSPAPRTTSGGTPHERGAWQGADRGLQSEWQMLFSDEPPRGLLQWLQGAFALLPSPLTRSVAPATGTNAQPAPSGCGAPADPGAGVQVTDPFPG